MRALHCAIAAAIVLSGSLLTPGGSNAQTPASATAESRTATGEINGASYRIDIPASWNKGLVMYAHGYAVVGAPPEDPDSPEGKALRDVFLSRGFAFARSAYGAQGWAVKEGIEDTEALRRHFVARYGRPSETYVTGFSMGGHIAIATIERYPEAYDGAMPMCGPLGPALDFMNYTLFDMLVTFEAMFPGTIGSPFEPGPATPEKVRAAVAANPQRAARYAQHFDRPVETLPDVLAFFQVIAAELKQRAGGEPFDNTNRIYVGFGEDAALNRAVSRRAARTAAREYLRQYFSPTGRTSDPVLAVHTTSDPLVLGRDVTEYEVLAAREGGSDRFVARFVDATGHCNFTMGQIGGAFDALLAWAREGKRPAAGEQK